MCIGADSPPPPPPPPKAPPVLEQEAPDRSTDTKTATERKRVGLSKYKINRDGQKEGETNSLGNVPMDNKKSKNK